MPFLLQVMWARPSAASATLPVRRLGRRSTSMRCVSVPPETMSRPLDLSVSASALAFCDDVLGVELERRAQRLAEGNGLGGDHMHQRAALQAGKDRRVDLLRELLVVGENEAASAGRAASCARSR